MICQYCNKEAVVVTGDYIYPHRPDLYNRKFYQCQKCNAYCGTHKETGKPLGTLANDELRNLRKLAHASFDHLWKKGRMSRKEAYHFLSSELQIDPSICHIGMFDEDFCKRVVSLCLLSKH